MGLAYESYDRETCKRDRVVRLVYECQVVGQVYKLG